MVKGGKGKKCVDMEVNGGSGQLTNIHQCV